MQTLAYRTILEGLKGAGIVQGEVEEMLQAEVGALFMPHGEVIGLVLLESCGWETWKTKFLCAEGQVVGAFFGAQRQKMLASGFPCTGGTMPRLSARTQILSR